MHTLTAQQAESLALNAVAQMGGPSVLIDAYHRSLRLRGDHPTLHRDRRSPQSRIVALMTFFSICDDPDLRASLISLRTPWCQLLERCLGKPSGSVTI